eukprot:2821989-Prymnesium_polylepis.1
MSRPPQPMPWPCNGRQRSPKPPSRAARPALSEDRCTITASDEAVCSWIRRLYHHHMTLCELWDAQTPALRPHRRVRRFRCALGSDARRAAAAGSARGDRCTTTASAEAIGSWIRRLTHNRIT